MKGTQADFDSSYNAFSDSKFIFMTQNRRSDEALKKMRVEPPTTNSSFFVPLDFVTHDRYFLYLPTLIDTH